MVFSVPSPQNIIQNNRATIHRSVTQRFPPLLERVSPSAGVNYVIRKSCWSVGSSGVTESDSGIVNIKTTEENATTAVALFQCLIKAVFYVLHGCITACVHIAEGKGHLQLRNRKFLAAITKKPRPSKRLTNQTSAIPPRQNSARGQTAHRLWSVKAMRRQ